MRNNTNLDEDDLQFSKLQHNFVGFSFKYRLALCLFLGLVLVILSVDVAGLSVFSLAFGRGCEAAALNSACLPLSHQIPVSSLTSTVSVKLVPTATPTFTPTPTQALSGAPSQAPTPTAFPQLTEQQVVTNVIEHYKGLMESGEQSALHKAYNLLSVDVRDQEPFRDFVKNPNYTLPKGCLIIGDVTVTQADDQTWDGSVPVTKVSCVDGTAIVYYSWHFRVHLVYGLPEIISLGLYPTGAGY